MKTSGHEIKPGADSRGADLGGADLRGADLRGAHLRGAYIGGADLGGADLRGADLGGANLGGANLRGAYLGGADLRGAEYTIPQVLVGQWGAVSDKLCLQLMRLDAEALPNGSAAMTAWANGGPCPLDATDGRYGRVALFREKRDLWKPGRPWSMWRIWKTLAAEKGVKISGVK